LWEVAGSRGRQQVVVGAVTKGLHTAECQGLILAAQDYEYNVLRRAHLPLTPSAGEQQVSGGRVEGESTGGPASQSTRSSPEAPKWCPSIFFGGLLKAFCRVAMVEPPVSYSYLESTVPAAACEVAISVGSAGRARSSRRV
jgi:hypothetical protein